MITYGVAKLLEEQAEAERIRRKVDAALELANAQARDAFLGVSPPQGRCPACGAEVAPPEGERH